MVDTDGIYTSVQELDDQQLRDLRGHIDQILETRRRTAETPGRMDQLIEEYQATLGRAGGDPWIQPTSALDSYPKGAVHTHPYEGEDRLWESLMSANPHEPGVSGWRLLSEKDEEGNEVPPPYIQPSGAHDAYLAGEQITWEDGEVYEAARDGVVHSPADHPDSWVLIEKPEEEDEPEEPGENEEDDGDTEEPEHEPWDPDGRAYTAGELLTYQGSLYEVLQAHTSQPGWTPATVPALYEPYESEV